MKRLANKSTMKHTATTKEGKQLKRGDVLRHKGEVYAFEFVASRTCIEVVRSGRTVPEAFHPSELGVSVNEHP